MRLALVGTGLIGASVGLAAKRAGAEVVGFDPDAGALEGAVEKGAVDEAAPSREAALQGAELAIVAAPVAHLAREHMAKTHDHSDRLWPLLSLGLWADRFYGLDGR